MSLPIEIILLSFVLGSLIGSFLNVVIHRIPLGISVIFPRSRCPRCEYIIKWYQNIPIFSYIFLRARCSNCKTKIPLRYPLIELLMGILAILLLPDYLSEEKLIFYLIELLIMATFLALFVIDIDHKLLPDKINLFLLSIIAPYSFISKNPVEVLLGGIIGFGSTYLITYLFYKLKGQIGLGGGDIKLFGIIGLYVGPIGIIHTIFYSSLLGSIIGLSLILFKKMDRQMTLAFGPYIIIMATLQILFPKAFDLINILQII